MVIAKTASKNIAFKFDKIIDALFQDKSVAQTRQSFIDADFEGLASNAELYIFKQDDSQEPGVSFGLFRLRLGLYIYKNVVQLL